MAVWSRTALARHLAVVRPAFLPRARPRGSGGLPIPLFVAAAFSVKCHDIAYGGCQDILYILASACAVFSAAENAEGARRAAGAFSALPHATTSARDPRLCRSISRMYICR